ncbi:hypothetical protein AZI86_00010 [Bdellovibrio bacteriovorus]|uniref:Imelysin-like domain-containing protein n=1 Tax=Bdellovibrio bacteriovorus TaxID=959 RepID=A0A150WM63_BDEBC|nr:imelysin family protein [Bdellovibrio bacteriovorus]KYG65500.1 hypothetical protein AZI86_00010 [Bdellovibrio bacteriovorus]
MKSLFVSLFAVLGFAVSAQAVTRAEVIQNVSYNVILKTYADFQQKSQELKASVDTLIAQPTQKNLEAAQSAWRAARYSYEVSEGFLFGPMDSLGIDPMIDTWPLALTDLKKILSSNYEINTEFVRGLPSEVQGFHAIEYFLFGEGITSNTRSVGTIKPREFAYLQAATELLNEQVALLIYSWTTHHDPEDTSSVGYYYLISQPGASNPFYTSEEAVMAEFGNGIVGILAEASGAKLPDATGETPEDANARLEESPFSWNSLNDYMSNVDSIYNVYTGTFGGIGNGPGLKALVAQQNPVLAEQVEVQILLCRQKIADIAGPQGISFGRAIKTPDGRVRIFAAIAELKKLEDMFTNQVNPLL